MNIQFIIDWKFPVGIGVGAALVILASKVDPSDAKEALVSSANKASEALALLSGSKLN